MHILKKMGLAYPNESGYIVHGSHFSGFYEAVGFCFMKEWGLNVVAQPKVFDKYKGYLKKKKNSRDDVCAC